ncbi:MAG: hypothetical protein JSS61_06090 [Verrucomicrobia bacterium]|nr:hypothetical protein [Verrucomicrobiota bacterium]
MTSSLNIWSVFQQHPEFQDRLIMTQRIDALTPEMRRVLFDQLKLHQASLEAALPESITPFLTPGVLATLLTDVDPTPTIGFWRSVSIISRSVARCDITAPAILKEIQAVAVASAQALPGASQSPDDIESALKQDIASVKQKKEAVGQWIAFLNGLNFTEQEATKASLFPYGRQQFPWISDGLRPRLEAWFAATAQGDVTALEKEWKSLLPLMQKEEASFAAKEASFTTLLKQSRVHRIQNEFMKVEKMLAFLKNIDETKEDARGAFIQSLAGVVGNDFPWLANELRSSISSDCYYLGMGLKALYSQRFPENAVDINKMQVKDTNAYVALLGTYLMLCKEELDTHLAVATAHRDGVQVSIDSRFQRYANDAVSAYDAHTAILHTWS